jgi:hypothetical protein
MASRNHIDEQSVIEQVAGCASAAVGDELVIMRHGAEAFFALDAIGIRIWHLLEEPRTGQALVDILVQEFDVSEAQCQSDLEEFLGSLLQEGLIRIE